VAIIFFDMEERNEQYLRDSKHHTSADNPIANLWIEQSGRKRGEAYITTPTNSKKTIKQRLGIRLEEERELYARQLERVILNSPISGLETSKRLRDIPSVVAFIRAHLREADFLDKISEFLEQIRGGAIEVEQKIKDAVANTIEKFTRLIREKIERGVGFDLSESSVTETLLA